MFEHFLELLALQRVEHDHLIQAVHELRRKLRRAASVAVRSTFSSRPAAGFLWLNETHAALHQLAISPHSGWT